MVLSSRDILSIVELVIYTPASLFTIFLCVRHGFGPNQGWLFLLIFGLLRLAGASLVLATITYPASIPLQTSAALISNVGLSPLLFSTCGLLMRVCRSIRKSRPLAVRTLYLKLLRLPIVIALVLVVIGSDSSAGDLINHGVYPIRPITKAGIILLAVTFGVIVLITGYFFLYRSHAEIGDRRLLKAVTASLVPLAVRLIYVFLLYFSHIRTFDILHGSVVANGCMAVMQEILVVILYIAVGLTLPKIEREAAAADSTSSKPSFRTRATGGLQRFQNFLDRPKAFLMRTRGQEKVESIRHEEMGTVKSMDR